VIFSDNFCFFLCADLLVFVAINDVGFCDAKITAFHQSGFYEILNIFDLGMNAVLPNFWSIASTTTRVMSVASVS
jgi:hypothetical protein